MKHPEKIKIAQFATQNLDHHEKVLEFLNSGIEVVAVTNQHFTSFIIRTDVYYREKPKEEHYYFTSEIRELWRDYCQKSEVDKAPGDLEGFLAYLEEE